MSVVPHPRILIEAVSEKTPHSFLEYMKVEQEGDSQKCTSPLSDKSQFETEHEYTQLFGRWGFRTYLDVFMSDERANILMKTDVIGTVWFHFLLFPKKIHGKINKNQPL